MSMKEEYTAIDMATAAAEGFRDGQRAAQSAGVPDGYRWHLVPKEDTDAFNAACSAANDAYLGGVGPCGVFIAGYRAMLAAAPTVKAEQVKCDTCHGQGEICVGQQTFGYMSMQPPEPIMEVCPECGGEEAPSLPAAGSAVEEVEVVGYRWKSSIHTAPDLTPYAPASTFAPGYDYVDPLMTVAQHQRIVAALSAQQSAQDDAYPPCDYCGVVPDYHPWHGSGAFRGVENPHIHACNNCRHLLPTAQSAPDRVSVPVELAERIATHLEWDGEESLTVVQYANKCDALAGELRALLASHAEGGKV